MRDERKIVKKLEKEEQKLGITFQRSNKRGRRIWNQYKKAILNFYASIEEKYESICPELNLLAGLRNPRRFRPKLSPVPFQRYLDLTNYENCIDNERMCVPENRPETCTDEDQLTFDKLSTGLYDLEFCS